MIRTLRHALLWGGLIAGLPATVYHVQALYGIREENERIRQLLSGKEADLSEVITGHPELRLARALFLKQNHRYDEALSTLGLIMNKGDRRFQAQTRYNLGNLYLEQAVQQTEAANVNEALPLAGLAKQAYREALALDSQNWDAKYNLEVAMRLLPEMDSITLQEEAPTRRKAQLWTTVPGFPRGLP